MAIPDPQEIATVSLLEKMVKDPIDCQFCDLCLGTFVVCKGHSDSPLKER